MKIYVASSWRNLLQVGVVHTLRALGHQVYDFRHPSSDFRPAPHVDGFSWRGIDAEWKQWTPREQVRFLHVPEAEVAFARDYNALKACDACCLVLPCGRSAHLELGVAVAQGKRTCVLHMDPASEAELMYAMVDRIATSFDEMMDFFGEVRS